MKLTERTILLGVSMVLIVLIINAVLSYRDLTTLIQSNAWVSHTHQVLSELESMLSLMKDAETGYRGFIISGKENYLEPYNSASGGIDGHLKAADSLLADNPAQLRHLADARALIGGQFELYNGNIARRKNDGFEAARAVVLTGRGKQLMDSLRGVVASMNVIENGFLRQRISDAEASSRRAIATFIIASVLGIVLVLAVYFLLMRDIRRRERNEHELKAAYDTLELRVLERTSELAAANQDLSREVAERIRTEHRLNLFTKELERSNRELQDFAFVASHDLQEPLRKIQAFSDRLMTKYGVELGDTGKDYLSRVQAAAARMHVLINDLLSYSRVTSQAQPFVQVDLEGIIGDVLSDLEVRIQQTGGRVDVGTLPRIEADALQMRQLFQNLIGNGLKFHRPDVPPVVTIRAAQDADRVAITVEDNGIGFDEKYLDRIFTPFQRLHSRERYEGTGMGLAVSRKIVERHGGSIDAESIPGSGATFHVNIPIQQPKQQ
ncbi:MAG: Signal transduction histidine kinase [Chlorobi bacterium]|nr:Signal transduction histidine kinase [Chlorobiota bacterium]